MIPKESEWTPPSPWCPVPGRWHAVDADATETEVTALVAAFVRALHPDIVVETGSNSGQTSEAIGWALADNNHGHLWTLEVDPDLADATERRCEGLPVTVVRESSLDWTPPGLIDFAWHDSHAHIRHLEIGAWLPHYTAGAIIGVHDTGPQHPVWAYLQPLINAGSIHPLTLRTPRGVTFAQVGTAR